MKTVEQSGHIGIYEGRVIGFTMLYQIAELGPIMRSEHIVPINSELLGGLTVVIKTKTFSDLANQRAFPESRSWKRT